MTYSKQQLGTDPHLLWMFLCNGITPGIKHLLLLHYFINQLGLFVFKKAIVHGFGLQEQKPAISQNKMSHSPDSGK